MKIEKISRLWIYVILSSAFIIAPTLMREIALMRYYPSPEAAVKNYLRTKNAIEVITVKGREGTVSVFLHQNNYIDTYTFDTQIKKDKKHYRVSEEIGLLPAENCMKKINTAPKSTEEIAFGMGADLAKECSEKTEINAKFFQVEWSGKIYTFWYIISPDGLDELPERQMDGVSFGTPENRFILKIMMIFFLIFGAIAIGITILVLWKFQRSKKNTNYN